MANRRSAHKDVRRQLRMKLYDALYHNIGQVTDPCTYCGVVSDTMDHIPAIVFVQAMRSVDRKVHNLRKVPACFECNSTLGAKPLFTLAERRNYIVRHLRQKYKKVLNIPQWSEDELSEVSDFMATSIRAASNLGIHTRMRIARARGKA